MEHGNVAAGYRTDLGNLINKFGAKKSARYSGRVFFQKNFLWKSLDFVATWQELEFWRLSYGRKLDHDKAAFMEDVFLITGSGSFQFLPNILPVGYNEHGKVVLKYLRNKSNTSIRKTMNTLSLLPLYTLSMVFGIVSVWPTSIGFGWRWNNSLVWMNSPTLWPRRATSISSPCTNGCYWNVPSISLFSRHPSC